MNAFQAACSRLISASVAVGSAAVFLAPSAAAVPAPEVEYTYNVIVRRHFNFPNNDAIGYGYRICERVARGSTYGDVMSLLRSEIAPNDEQSVNYVASYAVGILCPENISKLRDSAAGYQPPR